MVLPHASFSIFSASCRTYIHVFNPKIRSEVLQQAAEFTLARLTDEIDAVVGDAADAFSAMCGQRGCADTLASPQLLPSLSVTVVTMVDSPR